MQDPSKLEVFREAETLAVEVYQVTRDFPPDERYGLTAQLRRAAAGIGSTIAEGSGRFKPLDKAMFFSRAVGSAREVSYQLGLSARVGMLPDPAPLGPALERSQRVERMLGSLIIRVRGDGS